MEKKNVVVYEMGWDGYDWYFFDSDGYRHGPCTSEQQALERLLDWEATKPMPMEKACGNPGECSDCELNHPEAGCLF